MSPELPSVGSRLSHAGSLGTVRFAGLVDGTQGMWLGVEWDDPKRGKHDGVKDGKRYFTCLVPNSGSFIRPSAPISYGVTFLSALTAKYIETRHGSASPEKVILGSSGGAIEVEAVGLDKIRGSLARLERLREVSLDNERVSKADSPGEISRICAGIRGLDLSKNLLSRWDDVASIAIGLENLRSLRLNRNRLSLPKTLLRNTTTFRRLEELQLNGTLTTWDEFETLLLYMPSLRTVELGYNRLQVLFPDATSRAAWCSNVVLQDVNLDANELTSFADIASAINNLSALQRLILTSNKISQICFEPTNAVPEPARTPAPPSGLKHLALAFNRLAAWRDIDTLQRWCPGLESLTLTGNPLVDDLGDSNRGRAFTIARMPSLKSLDGAAISPRERTDSELLYLSHVSKQLFSSDEEKRAVHPRWQDLCTRHGVSSDGATVVETQDTLSNRLINIRIYHSPNAPQGAFTSEEMTVYLGRCEPEMSLRVLSTMSVRTFRLKLIKALKVPKGRHNSIRLWMILPSGHFVELNEEYAGRDLAYWGIDKDTQFVLVDN